MIDFPSSPATGQVVTSPSGVQWRWDGTAWLLAAQGGGARGRVAYAQSISNQALATPNTLYDIITATFTAVAGRTYRLSGRMFTTVNGGGQSVAHIKTVAGATVGQHVVQSPNSGGDTLTPVAVITPTVGGSVSYKLCIIQSAVGNLWADPTDPCFLLVEDITYEAGSSAAGMPNDSVTNAHLANMPANTFKGNNTGAAADPKDLTAAEMRTALGVTPQVGSWTHKYEGASARWNHQAMMVYVDVPIINGHRYLILGRAECLEADYAGGRKVGIHLQITAWAGYGQSLSPTWAGNQIATEQVLMRTWVADGTRTQRFELWAINNAGGGIWVVTGPYGGGTEINVIDVTNINI